MYPHSRHKIANGVRVALGVFGAMILAGIASPARAVECAVKAAVDQHSLHLEAIAKASSPVAGNYKLVVKKTNASGSSQNVQSGDFELQSAGEKTLSTIVLDHESKGDYSAVLSLEWKDGEASCHYP